MITLIFAFIPALIIFKLLTVVAAILFAGTVIKVGDTLEKKQINWHEVWNGKKPEKRN